MAAKSKSKGQTPGSRLNAHLSQSTRVVVSSSLPDGSRTSPCERRTGESRRLALTMQPCWRTVEWTGQGKSSHILPTQLMSSLGLVCRLRISYFLAEWSISFHGIGVNSWCTRNQELRKLGGFLETRSKTGSALDELHGADRTEEENSGHHQGMDGQPAESEDRVGHGSPRITPHESQQKLTTPVLRSSRDCFKTDRSWRPLAHRPRRSVSRGPGGLRRRRQQRRSQRWHRRRRKRRGWRPRRPSPELLQPAPGTSRCSAALVGRRPRQRCRKPGRAGHGSWLRKANQNAKLLVLACIPT